MTDLTLRPQFFKLLLQGRSIDNGPLTLSAKARSCKRV